MAGERDRFLRNAFHQAPVPGHDPGPVVDQVVAEARVHHALGQRHADGVGQPLPERPGRRLDARRFAIFRVSGGAAVQLAEIPDFRHRHIRITGQMQQRVEQHRAVPGREHETVPVRPVWPLRIELQELREQDRRRIRHAHRHPRMAALGGLHSVHGKRANGIGHPVVRRGNGGVGHGRATGR